MPFPERPPSLSRSRHRAYTEATVEGWPEEFPGFTMDHGSGPYWIAIEFEKERYLVSEVSGDV